jgi:hypothetical protein
LNIRFIFFHCAYAENFNLIAYQTGHLHNREKVKKGMELKAKQTTNREPRRRKKEEKERRRSSWG